MHRTFSRYTRILFLPLLAIGLVVSGCDSTGSNGDDGEDPFEYPSTTYGQETVVNLLAFDLGVRVGNAADNSESTLDDLYTGNVSSATLPTSGISAEQSTYGDIASGVTLSDLTDDTPLIGSENLESADSPSPGSAVTTDDLLQFYFRKAGADNVSTTSNGYVLSQFAEKMLLGTPIYGKGARILNDFVDGNVSSDQAEQWDAVFGYFGFPRTLEPFLNYSDGEEGLAGGNVARDVDGNGSVDLTSEYVHTWASYAIERSAAAANNGQPNDFARRAFDALVEGRQDIENGEDPAEHAQTALAAWEATVAVNVIHYVNSMESNIDGVSGTLEEGDVGGDAWGEAKAFAWNLQFYSDQLSDQQLTRLHALIGNDPPYGEMTASEYASDLAEATQILQGAYGFNSSNVEAW